MKTGLAAAAAAFALLSSVPSRAANPSLSEDFRSMTRWLSHEMANGLAFNAGSTFDPPREVRGWALQPDFSLGVGRIPFNKGDFPTLTVPALDEQGGSNIFPNQVIFPNLALHLRMGLPWRGDAYLRFADATTPPGYKISPTMTAQVQTNSYGFGLRQHLDLWDEALPKVALGAHYNHVRGRTRLKGAFNVDVDETFRADSELNGEIDWNLNSFGLTAVAHKSYEAWTPFLGLGYNYATGSVRSKLELKSRTFLISDVLGESSEHPEQSQGRWIAGVQYARPTWSAFFNAELKALGQLQYRSWIAQIGVALPYEIGRGPKIIYRKRAAVEPKRAQEDEKPAPSPKSRRPVEPKKPEQAHPDMIFLQ
ncbi:MAG: hypothetical protein HY403_10385 [Elusimicrobia bacterium]|nr:hypothetical protein [Elusimicrobiota bacterium]